MYTSLWGKHAWLFLHSIVYQREEHDESQWDSKIVVKFLNALGEFLPCPGCKQHYKDNQNDVEPNFIEAGNSLESLEKYLLAVHNAVNFTYNLPQVSLEKARNLHKNVDWYKNWAYYFKAVTILYKDKIPDEYDIITKMDTIEERKVFLEKYKIIQIQKLS